MTDPYGVYQPLVNALSNFEDALLQGRALDIYLLVNVDGQDTVDVSVTEHLPGQDTKLVFSELGYETVEAALIAIGENL